MNHEPPARDIRDELTAMLIDNEIEDPRDAETAADKLVSLQWGKADYEWAESLIARKGKAQP